MRLHRTLGTVLASCALVVGLTGAVAHSSPAPSSSERTTPKPTVVLVHGVFADASGWNATIKSLQDAGFPVIAPANPLRDLAGDSEYVSSVVASIDGPVILVGHSYGGEVVTNAARGNANVKALVYVAAFAPDQGETALDLAGKFPGSQLPPSLVVRTYPRPGTTDGHDGYIDPAKFHDVFAQDLPRKTTQVMAAAQRPGSLEGLGQGSGAPAWKTLPSWYVIPTADNVIPPAVQRFMAERAGSRTVEVKGASHVVMMSRPEVVVRQIKAAYRATD